MEERTGMYGVGKEKNAYHASVAYRMSCEGPESPPIAGAQPSLAPSATDNPREWSAVIRDFLSAAGLAQAVHGFDADMVMMNPSFERDVLPGALDDLLDSLVVSYTCRLAAPVTHCSALVAIGEAAATLTSEETP